MSVMWLVVALLCKPTAVVVPAIILFIDRLILQRLIRIAWKFVAGLVLVTVPFLVLARIIEPGAGIAAPLLPQRVLMVADTYGFYLKKLFVLWPLYMDYGRTPQFVTSNGISLLSAAAVSSFVLVMLTARRE